MRVSNKETVHPLYTMNSISFVGYYKHLEGWGIYEDYGIKFKINQNNPLFLSKLVIREE